MMRRSAVFGAVVDLLDHTHLHAIGELGDLHPRELVPAAGLVGHGEAHAVLGDAVGARARALERVHLGRLDLDLQRVPVALREVRLVVRALGDQVHVQVAVRGVSGAGEMEAVGRERLAVLPQPVRELLQLAVRVLHALRAQVAREARELLDRRQVLGHVALEVQQQVRLARPVVLHREAAVDVAVGPQVTLGARPELQPVTQPEVAVLGRRDRDVADVVLPHAPLDQLLDVRDVSPEAELGPLARPVLEIRLLLLGLGRRRLGDALADAQVLRRQLLRGGGRGGGDERQRGEQRP